MKTVLFIEDNTEIRENMGEILELANYNVLLAPDGKKGVALAQQHKPDIIVCDIMMPELDGYGVIHMLQKNPETQNIPFIFLTAKAERSEMRKGMELGADDYITKPFSGTELLNAIEGRLKKVVAVQSKPANLTTLTEIVNATGNKSLKQLFEEHQEIRNYQKRERIYTEGHQAYRLFYLVDGKVKIYKTNDDGKDLITTVCQAGDFFGYTALLEGVPYKENAETLENADIASITREAFEELMNNNPEVMKQFIKLLAGNVHEKEQQLLGIAYNSLRKKVAEALLMLLKKYRQEHAAGPTSMSISRDNLAAVAGTAKESLIRTLGDFRDEGLIEIKGSEIAIIEEQKLTALLN